MDIEDFVFELLSAWTICDHGYDVASIRSLISFGKNTHTVPTIAMMEQTTIKNQFNARSFLGISLPKIFK